MEFAMNILLNVFEFLGVDQANQIIIFIIILGLGLIYKLGELSRWVVGVFIAVMAVSLATALYQIAYNARPQCVFVYDPAKPVFADSLTRALNFEEVREKNCPTLWVARNEIYHRSGYCFYTRAGYSYFGDDGSCKAEVDGPSSEIGMKNVKLISRLENRKGCVSPPEGCRAFSRVSASKLVIGRPPLLDE